MIESYKNIIIAPHPDDELIGCYEILVNPDIKKEVVVFKKWFIEDNTERIKESENLANSLNYELVVLDDMFTADFLNIFQRKYFDNIVWIPSIEDNNQHHTYVNVYTKYINEHLKHSCNQINYIGEYTTKMNVNYKRLCINIQDKKEKLYNYFPSQSKYFDNYNDLYMFEGRIILQ